jgi:Ca2+-binding EF-hand superfamily protein
MNKLLVLCACCTLYASAATEVASKDAPKETAPEDPGLVSLKKAFADGDTNGDGFHDSNEIQASILAQAKVGLIDGFHTADKNLDGVVTEEEYLTLLPNKTAADFAKADTNSDGKHTLEEQTEFYLSSDMYKVQVEQAEKTAAEILKRDDANGDGKLSEEEFIKHSSKLRKMVDNKVSFDAADLDHDGFHTEDEIKTEIMRVAGFLKHKDGNFIEAGVTASFKAADVNDDGVVTKEEYLKSWPNATEADFESGDTNGDGKTTLDEAEHFESELMKETLLLAEKEASKHIKIADKNGDGKLSLDEKNFAMEIQHRDKTFKEGDHDGDGFHSQEEILKEIVAINGYSPVVDGRDGKNSQLMYYLPKGFLDGFSAADTNRDEKVSLEEFLAFFSDKTEEDFKKDDTNGDGFHQLNEMADQIVNSDHHKEVMAHAKTQSEEFIKKGDKDGDGKLSKAEFDAHIFSHQEL